MIRGIGIDIIEIRRISEAISRKSFVNRVFTANEQQYCDSRGVQKAASYAARFAAKEAVMKALGTGLAEGTWKDVEVTVDTAGKPSVQLTGFFAAKAHELGAANIYISLSHTKEYAVAQAILEGDGTL